MYHLVDRCYDHLVDRSYGGDSRVVPFDTYRTYPHTDYVCLHGPKGHKSQVERMRSIRGKQGPSPESEACVPYACVPYTLHRSITTSRAVVSSAHVT